MAIGHMIWPKLAEERPWVLPMVAEDQKRTGARGYVGQGYEMTCYATNTLWGFDPRHIRTKHVAVWWAHDDGSPGIASPRVSRRPALWRPPFQPRRCE